MPFSSFFSLRLHAWQKLKLGRWPQVDSYLPRSLNLVLSEEENRDLREMNPPPSLDAQLSRLLVAAWEWD